RPTIMSVARSSNFARGSILALQFLRNTWTEKSRDFSDQNHRCKNAGNHMEVNSNNRVGISSEWPERLENQGLLTV
ncbi:MAG: hypothetical protein PUC62_00535, partial [Oscillospiraceae bacterium]|nr:hypothetical protein [Oscillospiraceae bacterium]